MAWTARFSQYSWTTWPLLSSIAWRWRRQLGRAMILVDQTFTTMKKYMNNSSTRPASSLTQQWLSWRTRTSTITTSGGNPSTDNCSALGCPRNSWRQRVKTWSVTLRIKASPTSTLNPSVSGRRSRSTWTMSTGCTMRRRSPSSKVRTTDHSYLNIILRHYLLGNNNHTANCDLVLLITDAFAPRCY